VNRGWFMKNRREPGPGPDGQHEDGEELSSSPSSSPGTGKGPVRPAEAAAFADGGGADVMAPGPVLAGLVAKVTGTDGAALAAWGELVTLAEFTRRRPGALAGSAASRAGRS
jgi:hypothetical protein